jgi:hypothetical protein
MSAKYIVKTAEAEWPAQRFAEANALAGRCAASGTAFGIWSNPTGDWVEPPAEPLAVPAGASVAVASGHLDAARIVAAVIRAPGGCTGRAPVAPAVRTVRPARAKPMPPAVPTPLRRKRQPCVASNYTIMVDGYLVIGFCWLKDPADPNQMAEEGYCSCCGRRIKMRRVGRTGVGVIPAHLAPEDADGD